MTEEKEKKEVQETPKGFYVAEVPTSTARVVAFDGQVVDSDELLVKMANALKDAGILKD